MCRIDEFWNIHETFPHFFSKQAKLRQPHRAETADFRFQISNFEIRQIAFLMTCRPHSSISKNTQKLKILSTWSSLGKNPPNFVHPKLILHNRSHDNAYDKIRRACCYKTRSSELLELL